MDVGRFKAGRLRLTVWIVLPSLVAVVAGLGSNTLRLKSEWELRRIEALAEVLPGLAVSQRATQELAEAFKESGGFSLRTENELIVHLQETAVAAGFTVDSVKVDRREGRIPVLTAIVRGKGTLETVQRYLGYASEGRLLFSESTIKLTKNIASGHGDFQADLGFDLVLYDGGFQ